ncbi:AAA family ATPase [Vibrio hippocampi]|uniref:Cell division protein DamX n=1 Tax=Vibrio hippocampi TaxID=654686 RepID=A0ABN8DFH8_9VIBR|nr:AAA family ATPase [Vibrio hippocampi]CAH0524552.1 Cell division protein DamX [Vibrio hippocampi]
MSLSYEMRVLELDSQTNLLNRMQLLTQFASNMVVVKGEQGAGKTWLAHRFLEAWSQEKNQSLVTGRSQQDDAALRGNILQQLFPHQMYNTSDRLLESIDRILDREPCNIVIVVDNAQHVSMNLISELWELVIAAQDNAKQSFSIVLFTTQDTTYTHTKALAKGAEVNPVSLEVSPLSSDESERFFRIMVLRYLDENVVKKVETAFTNTPPIPGRIMALGEQKMERKVIIRSLVGSPVRIAVTVVVIALLLMLGYGWLLKGDDPQSVTPSVVDSTSTQQSDGSLEANNVEGSASTVIESSSSNSDADNDNLIEDDASALPPVVTSETASVGVSESGERVVITSDVVDALLDNRPEVAEVKAPEIKQAVAPETQGQSTESQSIGVQTPPEQNVVNSDAIVALQNPISFSFAREELNQLSANSYTLQLAAMTEMRDVQDFLDKHNFDKPVRIYPTLRGEEKWYIVTYDNYPSIQTARDAAEQLSAELQSLGPWAKSLRQVHREIARGQE